MVINSASSHGMCLRFRQACLHPQGDQKTLQNSKINQFFSLQFINLVSAFYFTSTVFSVIFTLRSRSDFSLLCQASGQSMRPTFNSNDFVLAEAISYKYFARSLKVGDVVVFTSPVNGRDLLLKRITALVSIGIVISPLYINQSMTNDRMEIKFDQTKLSSMIMEMASIIE